jgi:hypothetical protein
MKACIFEVPAAVSHPAVLPFVKEPYACLNHGRMLLRDSLLYFYLGTDKSPSTAWAYFTPPVPQTLTGEVPFWHCEPAVPPSVHFFAGAEVPLAQSLVRLAEPFAQTPIPTSFSSELNGIINGFSYC